MKKVQFLKEQNLNKKYAEIDSPKADYWKSQARKYCDFCKCWIADNKPSVEFHEKGRRHQDNVAKRLKYITKKSRYDEQQSVKVDAALQQMESAALEAYRKDIESNADITAVNITKKLEESNSVLSGKKIWKEAKAKDGKTYYWNIVTNESVWVPPAEGYMSITEQQLEADETTKVQLKAVEKQRQLEGRLKAQELEQEEMEERARQFREKLKERRVVDDIPPTTSGPIIPPGKNDPYGQWTVIQESPKIDFQLPKKDYVELPVIIDEEPPPPKEFKEKTVQCLSEVGGPSTFKKRKFGQASKRNVRQRLDND